MLRLQISCVEIDDHDDLHGRIRLIGGRYSGAKWRLCSADAIKLIEKGKYSFFVFSEGREVDVVVATKNGTKYLKTETDGDYPYSLLALSECNY